MAIHPILVADDWREARSTGSFQAENPVTMETIADEYPVSSWDDCDTALEAAQKASLAMRNLPGDSISKFLEAYADRIEATADKLVEMANQETGYPPSPRLADVELPRTSGQLRQAATAAREGSWSLPTIDTSNGIRSYYAPIGPVCVFGPNNFPFAFGSISGGDFAAAIAAGNPVIAKANSSHPGTTRLFGVLAQEAAEATKMPPGAVQLLYRTSHADGERLVSDPRIGATGYTGSRSAGLKLKSAADSAGKPIYLELSSVNPVVILPGALRERSEELADEFTASCLMGTGQFCTNPGLVVLIDDDASRNFISSVSGKFSSAPVGTLLSKGVKSSLQESLATLQNAGATLLAGNQTGGGQGYSHTNTLMAVSGDQFLMAPEVMQTEAFGNSSLFVVAENIDQACSIVEHFEGNLTGSVYSDTGGSDEEAYECIASRLRTKVGRLLNDKMPTGVAVSPAMNHGGPYPATGHPGFTAVGIPASLVRFAMLQSFDNVRPHRLPPILQDKNQGGSTWRLIDGEWTKKDV
jgi:NADP-dependent aldehyde dehydrogenase